MIKKLSIAVSSALAVMCLTVWKVPLWADLLAYTLIIANIWMVFSPDKLTTERPVYFTYTEAKEWMKGYNHEGYLKTPSQYGSMWDANERIQKILPKYPQIYYGEKGDWVSWEDFLGGP